MHRSTPTAKLIPITERRSWRSTEKAPDMAYRQSYAPAQFLASSQVGSKRTSQDEHLCCQNSGVDPLNTA